MYESELPPVLPPKETPADAIIAKGPERVEGEERLVVFPDGTTQLVDNAEEETKAKQAWRENR